MGLMSSPYDGGTSTIVVIRQVYAQLSNRGLRRTVQENRITEKWKSLSVGPDPRFDNTLKQLRFGSGVKLARLFRWSWLASGALLGRPAAEARDR